MKNFLLLLFSGMCLVACGTTAGLGGVQQNNVLSDSPLPPPYATNSTMNFSNVLGWKDGRTPHAPEGFTVTKYADGFENPRWLYVTPNGDVLVAESNTNHGFLEKVFAPLVGANRSNNLNHSADRITLLRDTKGTGTPDV